MENKLVNIIVVTYNQYFYTEKCVESLLACGYDKVIIYLVDNGSDQDKYNEFRQKYSNQEKIIFIRSEVNLGFGGGCNLALKEVKDGYIVFLNNDTEVAKGWLEPMVSYLEAHPEIGACQPKIKDINKKEYFEYAGAAGGFMDIYGYPFTRGRIFYTTERDSGQYDNIVDLVWCSGTAMMVKKEVLDKTGWFDEIFFMYGEEADLCWRINHVGYRQVFVPGSVVYHQGGGTINHEKKYSRTFYVYRSGLILLVKNYSVLELLKYLPIRIIFDFLNVFYFLFRLEIRFSLIIIKSYLIFLSDLSKVLKSRRGVISLRAKYSPVEYPMYKGSILLDYFLFSKKGFTDLNKKRFR